MLLEFVRVAAPPPSQDGQDDDDYQSAYSVASALSLDTSALAHTPELARFSLDVARSSTGAHVKELLHDLTNVPVKLIRLFFRAVEIRDSWHLYFVPEGESLVFTVGRAERGSTFIQLFGPRSFLSLPRERQQPLLDALADAQAGFRNGLKPVLAQEGTGGTYFLKSAATRARIACFKPRDEEPSAPNNPRGFVGLGGSPGLRHGVLAGEAMSREIACFLTDRDGFSGVPPTGLVEAAHPGFSYIKQQQQHEQLKHGVNRTRSASMPWNTVVVPHAKVGSFQLFVDADDVASDLSPSLFPTHQVHKVALLDMRMLNTDRNDANILVTRTPSVRRKNTLSSGKAMCSSCRNLRSSFLSPEPVSLRPTATTTENTSASTSTTTSTTTSTSASTTASTNRTATSTTNTTTSTIAHGSTATLTSRKDSNSVFESLEEEKSTNGSNASSRSGSTYDELQKVSNEISTSQAGPSVSATPPNSSVLNRGSLNRFNADNSIGSCLSGTDSLNLSVNENMNGIANDNIGENAKDKNISHSKDQDSTVAYAQCVECGDMVPEDDLCLSSTSKRDMSIILTPIDHGYCLPSKVEVGWCDWCWLDWPQTEEPIDQTTREWVASLDAESDAEMLRHELNIRDDCLRVMKISTMVLQRGVAAGLTIRSIAMIMVRTSMSKPSLLEQQVERASELAKLMARNTRVRGSRISAYGLKDHPPTFDPMGMGNGDIEGGVRLKSRGRANTYMSDGAVLSNSASSLLDEDDVNDSSEGEDDVLGEAWFKKNNGTAGSAISLSPALSSSLLRSPDISPRLRAASLMRVQSFDDGVKHSPAFKEDNHRVLRIHGTPMRVADPQSKILAHLMRTDMVCKDDEGGTDAASLQRERNGHGVVPTINGSDNQSLMLSDEHALTDIYFFAYFERLLDDVIAAVQQANGRDEEKRQLKSEEERIQREQANGGGTEINGDGKMRPSFNTRRTSDVSFSRMRESRNVSERSSPRISPVLLPFKTSPRGTSAAESRFVRGRREGVRSATSSPVCVEPLVVPDGVRGSFVLGGGSSSDGDGGVGEGVNQNSSRQEGMKLAAKC